MFIMTVSHLEKALKANKYILVRSAYSGKLFGINCAMIRTKHTQRQRAKKHGNKKTHFSGFMPCNFNEYLSHKGKSSFYNEHETQTKKTVPNV